MRALLPGLLLLGACAYRAGSFHHPRAAFAGTHVTQGCVDLAVARKPKVVDDDGGIVVQYEFGNGCDRPTTIDLAGVHVVGKTAEGREVKLVAWDPEAELTPLELDAHSVGSEAVAYRDPGHDEVITACIDTARVVRAGLPHWVCVAAATAADPQVGSNEDLGVAGDYVGDREHETRFGQWALPMLAPQIFLDWGLEERTVSLAAANTAMGSLAGAGGRVTAPAFTTTFRFGSGTHHWYLGAEVELGGVGGLADSGGTTPSPAVYGGGDFFVGARGALGPFSLSAEVALGGRIVQGSEVTDGVTTFMATNDAAAQLEARVRAELWLNPWISIGADAGNSVIQRDEHVIGGFVSFHTRAYAGDRGH